MRVIFYFAIFFYEIVMVARILSSWFRPNPYHPIVQWIYRVTDPPIDFVKRIIPTTAGGFDFSAMIVLILLDLFRGYIGGSSYFFW